MLSKRNKKFQDHTGEKINGWEILGIDEEDLRKHKRRWLCKHIECGFIKSVLYYQFQDPKHPSPRCPNCNKTKYAKKLGCAIFKAIKKGARDRNIEFNLTKEYLFKLLVSQNYKCAISGVDIWLANSNDNQIIGRHSTASLDRINSEKGYVEGNVQWVHKTVNKIKWNFSEEEFLWWIINIVGNNIEKILTLDIIDATDFLCKKHKNCAKLSEEDIKNIRQYYLSFETVQSIAQKYNVHKVTIQSYVSDLQELMRRFKETGEYFQKVNERLPIA